MRASLASSALLSVPLVLLGCGASDLTAPPSAAKEAPHLSRADGPRIMLPLNRSVISPDVSTAADLSYRGGIGGVGVETAPKIYLVFWGSQWSNDPSGEATILQNFFKGVGGSTWNSTVTQYCQGVASGTIACNGAGQAAGNPTGVFAAAWFDNAAAAPAVPTTAQLAAEAVNAAAHFGNTTAAKNASVQYLIATSHGNSASGFGTSYCAWHDYTTSSYGNIAYTNLPYITDAGAACGANFNGLGAKAGITIVSGHEFAETETDQFPAGGWIDSDGEELADKCAWLTQGQGASANITLSTGTFPVQSLWSNKAGSGGGACVFSVNTTTVCTPGDDVTCCPCSNGCTCPGDQICNAAGSGYGGCRGYACKGTECP